MRIADLEREVAPWKEEDQMSSLGGEFEQMEAVSRTTKSSEMADAAKYS